MVLVKYFPFPSQGLQLNYLRRLGKFMMLVLDSVISIHFFISHKFLMQILIVVRKGETSLLNF